MTHPEGQGGEVNGKPKGGSEETAASATDASVERRLAALTDAIRARDWRAPEGQRGSANRHTTDGGHRSSRHGRPGSGRRPGSGPEGGRGAIRRPDRPRELPDGADPADRRPIDREATPRRAKGSARAVLGRGVALGASNGVDLMAHGQWISPSGGGITTRGPVTPSGQDERRDRPEHHLAPSRQW